MGIERAGFVALLFLVLFAGTASFATAQESPPTSRRAELEFKQKKALANLQELEDRMFQLSELLQTNEPDQAMRLLLGLQKSREDLLAEDMEEISELIRKGSFDAAEERQRKVLFRLRELRELLLSTDLDLILKLQRLRKMNAALKQLGRISREETRLRSEAEQAAKREELDEDAKKKLAAQGRAQLENRKLNDILRAELGEIADEQMKSPSLLGAASKEMRRAEKGLSKAKPAEALPRAQAAEKKLGEARTDLEAARQRLLDELQRFIRRAVLQTLFQMVENQQLVNEDLAVLTSKEDDARMRRRRRRIKAKRVEDRQREVVTLARDAIQLLEETEYAVVMPWAMRYIQEWAQPNIAPIAAAKYSLGELHRGEKVVADCRELIDLLSEEDKFAKQNEDNPDSLKLVKILAELRALRLLQSRVLADTELASREDLKSLSAEELKVLRRVRAIRNWEATIRDLTLEVDKRGAGELLGGDDEEGF
jgi:hypothetical protein